MTIEKKHVGIWIQFLRALFTIVLLHSYSTSGKEEWSVLPLPRLHHTFWSASLESMFVGCTTLEGACYPAAILTTTTCSCGCMYKSQGVSLRMQAREFTFHLVVVLISLMREWCLDAGCWIQVPIEEAKEERMWVIKVRVCGEVLRSTSKEQQEHGCFFTDRGELFWSKSKNTAPFGDPAIQRALPHGDSYLIYYIFLVE